MTIAVDMGRKATKITTISSIVSDDSMIMNGENVVCSRARVMLWIEATIEASS